MARLWHFADAALERRAIGVWSPALMWPRWSNLLDGIAAVSVTTYGR